MEFSLLLEQVRSFIVLYGFKMVGATLTLVIGFWVISWVTRVVNNTMEKRGLDATIRPFLGSLVSVGLKILLLLSAASMFGIETTSFIAIFSALAFAIGLALQGSLGHFASGVMLLVFKPYKVGDLVNIGGGQTGTVEGIQVFNTVLKTLDNKRIFVPNAVVTGNVITNITGQNITGIELEFGIGYGDSIDKAREAILKVGKECPWILDDPAQAVVVASWGDSSVNLVSRPFCKSEHYWATRFYMQENVKKEFDKIGVSIPFPQMDVHLAKVN